MTIVGAIQNISRTYQALVVYQGYVTGQRNDVESYWGATEVLEEAGMVRGVIYHVGTESIFGKLPCKDVATRELVPTKKGRFALKALETLHLVQPL